MIDIDLVIYYVRLFATNMCVYYCFDKISNNNKNNMKNNIILILANLILILLYVVIKSSFNSVLLFASMYFIYTLLVAKLTSRKFGYTMLVMVISYALLAITQGVAVILQFIPYKLFEKFLNLDSKYINLIMILCIQIFLLYEFFRIKRFKNGFSFLNNKLQNDLSDIIIVNVGALIILVYCITGSYYEEITQNLFITFFILIFSMFLTIQKMFTMYYKQKLLLDTMDEYKNELLEKQKEIDDLKKDKQNISKITHEFYNRQKALELLVTSNMNSENIDKNDLSPKLLGIIDTLTSEYSSKFSNMKELPKLEVTGIAEIDSMFKYMQSECANSNINFKLKIMGNIYPLINNNIELSRLETLIGDHIRDAINAVNLESVQNKEVLVILGVKNKKYEFSVFDTGVDFEIDTLLKLGLEPITTNAKRGGTGTGFMTTFETLAKTMSSLVITEYPKAKGIYTKCVTIRFDGKKQYILRTYRAEEIKQKSLDDRIKIEKQKK